MLLIRSSYCASQRHSEIDKLIYYQRGLRMSILYEVVLLLYRPKSVNHDCGGLGALSLGQQPGILIQPNEA